ncbi:MAG TPA: hypothetical protein VEK15_18665, partial [Vicinamibacteria bacterium]|nr:hypothetical protein [Vicinamibacteria bacterium]
RIVGHEAFDSMARRYALAYAPRFHDLGRIGDRLSRFLETDFLSTKLPFLPDLARLEWALAEAFVSEDAKALLWDDLQAMNPESVSEMPLKLMPGTAVIRSKWPLIDIWECKDRSDHEISVQVEDRPSTVLVFRRGYQSHCTEASETIARIVEAASGGTSLLGVQEALGADGDPAAIVQILGAFRRMVGEGLFVNPTQ